MRAVTVETPDNKLEELLNIIEELGGVVKEVNEYYSIT